jgi:hemolysin III
VFQVLDHSAIYLLIAGTYTPFTLGVRGPWLDAVWPGGQAAGGCAGQIVCRDPLAGCPPSLPGDGLVAVVQSSRCGSLMALELFWLVAGGLAYTFGVIFSCWTAPARYGHFIWHFRGDGDACTRWRFSPFDDVNQTSTHEIYQVGAVNRPLAAKSGVFKLGTSVGCFGT